MATFKTKLYKNLYNISGVCVILFGLFSSVKYHTEKNLNRLLCMALSQTFFILEIVNIAMGVSGSSYILTALYVVSRLFISWVVCYLHSISSACVMVMYVIWGLSDLIRYVFYLTRSDCMKTLRYNAILVLYPISVCLEIYLTNCIYLMYTNFVSYIFSGAMLLSLGSFFYVYYQMLQQRKRSLKITRIIKNKKKA